MGADERAALEDAAMHPLKHTICGWTSTGPKMLPMHRNDIITSLARSGLVVILREEKLMDRATITDLGRAALGSSR